MKKIYLLILIIIIALIGIIIYLNVGRSEFDAFYAIKEAKGYVIKDDARMHFDIYSKLEHSLISYEDKNIYQLKDGNSIYNLENVSVTVSKNNDLYVNRIDADIINVSQSLDIKDAILFIKNESYTLTINVGYVSFLNTSDYELLSYNKYYGSYAYINQELKLVGINLELTDKFNKLKDFKVSNFAYGNLNDAKPNLYGNEVDIKSIINNYNPNYIKETEIEINDNKIFIPLSYQEILMIKEAYITLNLDGTDFYIDHFSFIVNSLNSNDYKMEEGIINYAKSK